MRGIWAIALLGLLITPCLWAQRSGGHAGGSMGHSGFGSHASAMSGHGFAQSNSFNNGIHFHPNPGNTVFFRNGFSRRRFVFTTPWFYGYPAYYYPYYSDYYGSSGYS